MIPGVRILNVEIFRDYIPGWSIWSALFLVLTIIGLIITIYAIVAHDNGDYNTAFASLIAGICLLCLCGFGSIITFCSANEIITYGYDVVVEDTVRVNDFTDKYDIIEQYENDVLLIKEKDPEAQKINRAPKERGKYYDAWREDP